MGVGRYSEEEEGVEAGPAIMTSRGLWGIKTGMMKGRGRWYGNILPMLERSGCAIKSFEYPGGIRRSLFCGIAAVEFVWFYISEIFAHIWWNNIV